MPNNMRILVPLADSPGSLRAAEGVPVGDGRFRLEGHPSPEDAWQFKPGEIVECSSQTLADGSKALVAVSSVTSDPEYRSSRAVYAVVGAVVGAFVGAWCALGIHPSAPSVAVGAVLGGGVFAICSVRWRDAAWRAWSRLVSSE